MSAVAYTPRYTIEDYLGWEGDWELWNGIPVAMAPSPDFWHQRLEFDLGKVLDLQLAASPCEHRCQVCCELDWHVDDNTVVRPDVMVVCEEPEGKWVTEAPVLAAEILSPSTRSKDLIQKRELFSRNGVKYYLLADPDEKNLTILELDGEDTYRDLPLGGELRLHEDCVLRLEASAIFR